MNCADVYTLFFHPGEVTEIRSFGLNGKGPWQGFARGAGIVYGYFDNAEDFGKAGEALDKAAAPGIYFTLNPCNPALLSRASNRLKAADMKTAATTDKDILCLRWLYVDLDPKRPTGISASDDELAAALALRDKITDWIQEASDNLPTTIKAMSGNGGHALVRLPDLEIRRRDDPGQDHNVLRIKAALAFLHKKFSTPEVEVDVVNFNPSRICKLYGTTARKGDHTEARPHRKSYIEGFERMPSRKG